MCNFISASFFSLVWPLLKSRFRLFGVVGRLSLRWEKEVSKRLGETRPKPLKGAWKVVPVGC